MSTKQYLGSRSRFHQGAISALVAFIIVLILTMFAAQSGQAQTYTKLYEFQGGNWDGSQPLGPLLRDSAGNLYGTTQDSGKYLEGTVFRLSAGGKETVLYGFSGGSEGSFPRGGLTGDASGNLYGVTWSGYGSCDAQGCGAIYKLNGKTRQLTVVHTFTAGSDGGYPNSGLIGDSAGNLYGTTSLGGSLSDCGGSGCGTIFTVDSAGTFSTLHAFTTSEGGGASGGLLRDTAGNLYGSLSDGGRYSLGAVFQLNAAGRLKILYSFDGLSGQKPYSGVVRDSAGNLYGTTFSGGDYGPGTVYRLNLKTHTQTVLYSFTGGNDGRSPWEGSLVRDAAGNLYGTTLYGGDSTCGCGTVFKLDPSGSFTVLHTFTGPDGGYIFDGLILDAVGNLYGTATGGGAYNAGVVFEITP